jgi:O-antigen biosynthesis protein
VTFINHKDRTISGASTDPARAAPPASRSDREPGSRYRWRRLFLSLRVHADAFRSDPRGYLQAVGWRARGLKLRSRHRFAALTGRSPNAYALWMLKEEPRARAAAACADANAAASIFIVIDCSISEDGLDDTLSSLNGPGPCGTIVIVGAAARPGTFAVARSRDLAAFAPTSDIWICPVQPGDRLCPRAVGIYAAAAAEAGTTSDIVYADDDLMGPDGHRHSPHLKPAWNPELFEHHDFISGAGIVRVNGGVLRTLPDDGWQRALFEHGLISGGTPKHLPLVLHHRTQRPDPVLPAKPTDLGQSPTPSVSVIIPTRNKIDLLRNCLDGLYGTAYPSLEVIVVDNETNEPEALAYLKSLERKGIAILPMSGKFNFSALNNAAVRSASGEFLCFLNNDVEILDPDWLALLVRQAVRTEIGAVGARLLYPDGTIQHAGVSIGIGGGAGHVHRFQRQDEPGYFERTRLPQRVSAVTAACLVVARTKFLAVGGFDEVDFPVAFNDVDLCLKLNAQGWQSFYEPRATLIHHESKSRGKDSDKANRSRFAAELAALKRKWLTDIKHDPYHHLHLSRFSEQFCIAL